ncbi:MAG: hypothetical protein ABIW76_19705 [Fibrobacteria bacterium]
MSASGLGFHKRRWTPPKHSCGPVVFSCHGKLAIPVRMSKVDFTGANLKVADVSGTRFPRSYAPDSLADAR